MFQKEERSSADVEVEECGGTEFYCDTGCLPDAGTDGQTCDGFPQLSEHRSFQEKAGRLNKFCLECCAPNAARGCGKKGQDDSKVFKFKAYPNACGALSAELEAALADDNPQIAFRDKLPEIAAYLESQRTAMVSLDKEITPKTEALEQCRTTLRDTILPAATTEKAAMSSSDVKQLLDAIFDSNKEAIGSVENAKKLGCGSTPGLDVEESEYQLIDNMAEAFDTFMESEEALTTLIDSSGVFLKKDPSKLLVFQECLTLLTVKTTNDDAECACSCQLFCQALSDAVGTYKRPSKSAAAVAEAKVVKQQTECADLEVQVNKLVRQKKELQSTINQCADFRNDVTVFLQEMMAIYESQQRLQKMTLEQNQAVREANKAARQAKIAQATATENAKIASAKAQETCEKYEAISKDVENTNQQVQTIITTIAEVRAFVEDITEKQLTVVSAIRAISELKLVVSKVLVNMYQAHSEHVGNRRVEVPPSPKDDDFKAMQDSLEELSTTCAEYDDILKKAGRIKFQPPTNTKLWGKLGQRNKEAGGNKLMAAFAPKEDLTAVVTKSTATDYCDPTYGPPTKEVLKKDVTGILREQADGLAQCMKACNDQIPVDSTGQKPSDDFPAASAVLTLFGSKLQKSQFGVYLQNWNPKGKFLMALANFQNAENSLTSQLQHEEGRIIKYEEQLRDVREAFSVLSAKSDNALEECRSNKQNLAEVTSLLNKAKAEQTAALDKAAQALAAQKATCEQNKQERKKLSEAVKASLGSFLQLLDHIGAVGLEES